MCLLMELHEENKMLGEPFETSALQPGWQTYAGSHLRCPAWVSIQRTLAQPLSDCNTLETSSKNDPGGV